MPQKAPSSDALKSANSDPLSSDKEGQKDALDPNRLNSQGATVEDVGDDAGEDFLGALDTGEDSPDIDNESPVLEPAKPASSKLKSLHQDISPENKPVEKFKRNIYISKQTVDAINDLAKARNVNGSKVVELAVALFYKNYFEREFLQISDVEIFVEELNTLVAEQSQEVSHLAELVTRVLDAEMELPTEVD